MSAFKVIEAFVDLQDDNYVYHVGDKFPHDDTVVSEARINALLSKNNRRKMPLIKEVEVEEVLDTIPEEVFDAVPEEVEEVAEEEAPEAEVELMNPPEEVVEVEEVKTTRSKGRKSQK